MSLISTTDYDDQPNNNDKDKNKNNNNKTSGLLLSEDGTAGNE